MLPNTYKPCPRKLSLGSMRYPRSQGNDPLIPTQTNNENPFAVNHNSTENDKEDKSNSASDNEIKSENNNFKAENMIGEKTYVKAKKSKKWENDNINTYAEIFEDGHESDNGSDWKISTNDPLEFKEQGFPSLLPTSDFGSFFSM